MYLFLVNVVPKLPYFLIKYRGVAMLSNVLVKYFYIRVFKAIVPKYRLLLSLNCFSSKKEEETL